MSEIIKPMLAYTVDHSKLDQLKFPTLASRKLDGIRTIILDGKCMSRTMKPIPNEFTQARFGHSALEGLDGELIVGEANDPQVYSNTNSGVMSVKGEPEVYFFVFDCLPLHKDEPYSERYARLRRQCENQPYVVVVDQVMLDNSQDILDFEDVVLLEGFEGLMLRDPRGVYKHGRSTEKQGIIGKLKNFTDSEAIVIGFECLYKNGNEATQDELGHTKRSNHQENMIPQDLLGKFLVKDLDTGVEFSIGSGFNLQQRKELWELKDDLIGKVTKYKSFKVGVKDKPRFPIFLGFRDPMDM